MASIPWEAGHNVKSLLEILGSEEVPSYDSGQLTVNGVTQAELEAAAAEYQGNLEAHYLAPMREKKKAHIQKTAYEFISSRYSPQIQQMLHALLTEAQLYGFPNRVAYLGPMLAWCKIVAQSSIIKEQEIDAAQSKEEITAVALNLVHLASLDPAITVKAAILIGD